MKANDAIRPIARLAQGLTTLLLILLGIIAIQSIIAESAWLFWRRPPAPSAASTPPQLTPEEARTQRIQQAEKKFLPDGTLHLVTTHGGPRWQFHDTPAHVQTRLQFVAVEGLGGHAAG